MWQVVVLLLMVAGMTVLMAFGFLANTRQAVVSADQFYHWMLITSFILPIPQVTDSQRRRMPTSAWTAHWRMLDANRALVMVARWDFRHLAALVTKRDNEADVEVRVSRKFVAFSAILALAIVAAGSVIALVRHTPRPFLQSLFWAVLFAVLEPLILLVHSRIWLKIACREMIYLQWVRLQPAQEAIA